MFSRLSVISGRQGFNVQKRLFSYCRPLFNGPSASGSTRYDARSQLSYEQRQTKIVPKLATFYSANPQHEAHIDHLETLLRKYINYPTVQLEDKPAWLGLQEYALIGGGSRLKTTQYKQLLYMLNRLNSIEPQLMTEELTDTLRKYHKKTKLQPQTNTLKELDEFGRSVAVGRRKTSTAKVYVVRGEGKILVNDRSLNDYFVKMKDRESIMYPFKAIDSVGKYNVFAMVSGGGITAQADAIMHAIGKALVAFNPLLKTRLHRSGVLTRDYRHVERKKPGKRKARKMPTWVKR